MDCSSIGEVHGALPVLVVPSICNHVLALYISRLNTLLQLLYITFWSSLYPFLNN